CRSSRTPHGSSRAFAGSSATRARTGSPRGPSARTGRARRAPVAPTPRRGSARSPGWTRPTSSAAAHPTPLTARVARDPTLYARRVLATDRPSFMSGLARTDTGRAAGLGAAVIAANVVSLIFTVVLARDADVGLHHPDGPGLGAAGGRGARGERVAGRG